MLKILCRKREVNVELQMNILEKKLCAQMKENFGNVFTKDIRI